MTTNGTLSSANARLMVHREIIVAPPPIPPGCGVDSSPAKYEGIGGMDMRVLIALLFMALASSAIAQDVPEEQPVEPGATREQPAEQPAKEPEPIPAVMPAEPPDTEHDGGAAEGSTDDTTQKSESIFLGDGVAQWVMAVTGIGALGLSGWAVWLLKKTLEATRDIGQAQTRAYLTDPEITIFVDPENECMGLVCGFKNSGNTPAREIVVSLSIHVTKRPPLSSERYWLPMVGVQDVSPTSNSEPLKFIYQNVKIHRDKYGENFEMLHGVYIEIAIFGIDVFDKEIICFATFAIGWQTGEDRTCLKPMGRTPNLIEPERLDMHRKNLRDELELDGDSREA